MALTRPIPESDVKEIRVEIGENWSVVSFANPISRRDAYQIARQMFNALCGHSPEHKP